MLIPGMETVCPYRGKVVNNTTFFFGFLFTYIHDLIYIKVDLIHIIIDPIFLLHDQSCLNCHKVDFFFLSFSAKILKYSSINTASHTRFAPIVSRSLPKIRSKKSVITKNLSCCLHKWDQH